MIRGEIGNAPTVQMNMSRPEGKQVMPSISPLKKINN